MICLFLWKFKRNEFTNMKMSSLRTENDEIWGSAKRVKERVEFGRLTFLQYLVKKFSLKIIFRGKTGKRF